MKAIIFDIDGVVIKGSSEKHKLIFETIKKYNLKPNEVLFIDDKIKHIERVKSTNVNLLHYTDYSIDIEDNI